MSAYLAVYRSLISLCPKAFRDEFGADMVLNVRDSLRAHPTITGRTRVLSLAVIDLLCTALAERFVPRSVAAVHPISPKSTPMEASWQDLRFALRSLSRRPTFAAAVVITLALGIGANTAIFSLVDAVLLHPLPVRAPSELLSIYEAMNAHDLAGRTPYPAFRAMSRQNRAFAGIAGFYNLDVGAQLGREPEQLTAAAVSGNYFSVLGVTPHIGRLIVDADDDAIAAHPVVVLSDAAWASAFNRRPNAVGAVIHIGDAPYTVIGVAPAEFRGTELDKSPRLWVPITMVTSLGAGSMFSGTRSAFVFTTHNFGWVHMVGRLRTGATATQATTELNTVLSDLARDNPGARRALQSIVKSPMNVVPVVQGAALSERASLVRFVTMLLVVVALTLLVACVNVANLMYVRSAERARELGIRSALGAGRTRIARQLLIESLLLGGAGAATGIGFASIAMRLLARFTLPGGISLADVNLGLDERVLAFTAVLAVLTAVAFGLAPSISASRIDLVTALKSHGQSTRRSARGVLIAAQVAMSLILLIGASLFVRSLRAGLRADIGFDPHPLTAISFDPMLHNYDKIRGMQLYDELVSRARQIPGVTAAAVTTHVPLAAMLTLPFSVEHDGAANDDPFKAPNISAGLISVTSDYFDVIGDPIVAGRGFTDADDGSTGKVAVINESAAKVFFPDRPPVGGTMHLLGMSYIVVGVVRDTKYESVRDTHVPVMFAPLRIESSLGGLTLVVRTGDRGASLAGMREAFRAIDPTLSLHDARFVADQIDTVLMPQRFGATLLGIFSLVALGVSAAGIFGVVAFGVAQRSTEIGIRIALGAQRADVLRIVLWRVSVAGAIGGGVGVLVTAGAARALERFLFGIKPLDAAAFGSATMVLCAAVAIAAWIPARRATRIDPMVAMRSE